MTTEIAGMTYKRAPALGEQIRVSNTDGAFISVKVYAGDEVIAFEQYQETQKSRVDESRRARVCNRGRAQVRHWLAQGFDVTDFVT